MVYDIIMQISNQQEKDGIRMVWNVTPNTKIFQGLVSIPQALHYTPFTHLSSSALNHVPECCINCGSFMNCYNKIHHINITYQCCVCKHVGKLPITYFKGLAHHDHQGENHQYPKELMLDYSTYEYNIQKPGKLNHKHKMDFLFVVDLTIEETQLDSVKEAILQLLEQLADQHRVGLITYNKYVDVYDFGANINTIIRISPSKHYSTIEISDLLNIEHQFQNKAVQTKYIVPLLSHRQAIKTRIKWLHHKKQKCKKHEREQRAVGQALNVALCINEIDGGVLGLCFCVGGLARGGLVDYKTQMRGLNQQMPKQSQEAIIFYNALTQIALSKMIIIDSFIFGLQEAGFTQMAGVLTASGGFLIQHELFQSRVFRDSFRKAYIGLDADAAIQVATEAIIKIRCSQQILLNGLLGGGYSIPIKSQNYSALNISPKQIGNGKTNTWYIGQLDRTLTLTLMFQLSQPQTDRQAYYIQLQTRFTQPNAKHIETYRVTTVRRLFGGCKQNVQEGFDQQAAVGLLAKLSLYKSGRESKQNVRLWLDHVLCKWALIFANYTQGEQQSFTLPTNMRFLPQYVYHLRRSFIIGSVGLSLDQHTYHTKILNRQTIQSILTILQPALLQYTLDHPEATAVALDERFINDEGVLVLDTYFNVVEWYGEHLYAWYEHKYHQMQEYWHIKQLINAPKQDIQYIRTSRFPQPQYDFLYPGHQKQRLLKSRLNTNKPDLNEKILSHDADVHTFTQHFVAVVVNYQL